MWSFRKQKQLNKVELKEAFAIMLQMQYLQATESSSSNVEHMVNHIKESQKLINRLCVLTGESEQELLANNGSKLQKIFERYRNTTEFQEWQTNMQMISEINQIYKQAQDLVEVMEGKIKKAEENNIDETKLVDIQRLALNAKNRFKKFEEMYQKVKNGEISLAEMYNRSDW